MRTRLQLLWCCVVIVKWGRAVQLTAVLQPGLLLVLLTSLLWHRTTTECLR